MHVPGSHNIYCTGEMWGFSVIYLQKYFYTFIWNIIFKSLNELALAIASTLFSKHIPALSSCYIWYSVVALQTIKSRTSIS
jgi:tryptophan-rich sensory protein